MSNAILDIIKLTGGSDTLDLLDIEPPGQARLRITRTDDGSVISVILGETFLFNFERQPGNDKEPYVCADYTPYVDRVIRERGYVEAAIQHLLQTL